MSAEHLSHTTPSLPSALLFSLKARVHQLKRAASDRSLKIRRFPEAAELVDAGVLAESRSLLWESDREQQKILTAGKVQNLRVAARKLNGVVVPGGTVFSFWAHVGKPSRLRGFVKGRELREGCIIPTTGGGLCQLSNALYDAAMKAGFEILERHKHSKIIPGSLAEKDRDATVFWNYIDLRFRSSRDFRIEIDMSATALTIRFRGKETKKAFVQSAEFIPGKTINDCLSCGVSSCFRNVPKVSPENKSTAWLLGEKWPEFNAWMKQQGRENDSFHLPLNGKRFKKPAYDWNIPANAKTHYATIETLVRSRKLRSVSTEGNALQSVLLESAEQLAKTYARQIDYRVRHLVVTQELLPFLAGNFALSGRTFDVLMTRLPLFMLQKKLDEAQSLHPRSRTLGDFRAPENLVLAEKRALEQAGRIITPHPEIAALYPGKAVLLEWKQPMQSGIQFIDQQILFPASALGRKGAYEMKEAALRLGISLTVLGKATEYEGFWGAVSTTVFDGDWRKIGLVVLPAFVEHQPRILLKAISLGIPVIATAACGLAESENVTIIEGGNVRQLIAAIQEKTEMRKAV